MKTSNSKIVKIRPDLTLQDRIFDRILDFVRLDDEDIEGVEVKKAPIVDFQKVKEMKNLKALAELECVGIDDVEVVYVDDCLDDFYEYCGSSIKQHDISLEDFVTKLISYISDLDDKTCQRLIYGFINDIIMMIPYDKDRPDYVNREIEVILDDLEAALSKGYSKTYVEDALKFLQYCLKNGHYNTASRAATIILFS